MEKEISFEKVDYERDVERIHKWMNEPHVIPFWQLDYPIEKFSKHLQKALADAHQTLWLGSLEGVPMSYWESYWVNGDVVEKCYEADRSDRGIHLLIGDTAYLGKGYSLPMLESMVGFQFQVHETTKIIAEPDIRNEKMIHVFEQCGFERVKPIELPDKTGLLMFCHRDVFERRRKHDGKRRIQANT
ncbi:GNAT family N-acetyltransferase [Pseudalkalibacillus salsuginis]|uniref:GNAT family N-acetyltransferase n=1 Tax=Pseudalkalibacillus salsuginis TaxID=2910972 RepID=UPI001F16E52A|nr:GNAT family N-acetyltransferase [Pseudalkalibacillus salsuginis]MCF6409369.1 acetyltransferase [Pseudalkalibacillus salsuginis]